MKLINLKFGYNKNNLLIDNLNWQLLPNDLIVLYGFSGSWKTTLLNLIGWLLMPLDGKVEYNNISIYEQKFSKLCKYRSNTIGYSFQNFNLLDDFSVNENLNLAFMWWAKKDKVWANYLIETLKIKLILNKKVHNISWWEKERVSLVKAMIHKPEILLLDEPANSLNKELRQVVYDLIQEYVKKDNNICIMTTHDETLKEYYKLELIGKTVDVNIYSNWNNCENDIENNN